MADSAAGLGHGPRRASAVRRRLLDGSPASRRYVSYAVALGALTTALVIAQAWLIADIVDGAFHRHQTLAELRLPVELLLVVVFARSLDACGSETVANRCSARAKCELRDRLLERAAVEAASSAAAAGEVATLATRGIDALDAYFARYLPQLVLCVLVPVAVLAVILPSDWVAAAIIAVTIPLVPVFMALIGATTRESTQRQLATLQRLSGHFLDVVVGLPTLKVFGRAKAQAATIARLSERCRETAMANLRVTFLSSLALELLATISVALVAVAVGLQLMAGRLELRSGLFVLVLAPEAYLALRQLGAGYHAGAEGLAAAGQVFEVLDRPTPAQGNVTLVPDPARRRIIVAGLRVRYGGRPEPVIDGVSFEIEPGETVAITGPSGCGKSTLLKVLLRLLDAEAGHVSVGGIELTTLDRDAWRGRVAWVPQRAHLFAGSIADNVRLGRPDASDRSVRAALAAAGLDEVVGSLPGGMATELGERGAGLSAGERQRVVLARAFLRDAPLLLLDEPTANLDRATEQRVVEAIVGHCRGRTVLLVAHRPALLELADRVLHLAPAVPV
jgi:thiol reductant ABC exporter CydD subunit